MEPSTTPPRSKHQPLPPPAPSLFMSKRSTATPSLTKRLAALDDGHNPPPSPAPPAPPAPPASPPPSTLPFSPSDARLARLPDAADARQHRWRQRWACEICFSRTAPRVRTCPVCAVNTCTACFSSWLEMRIQAGHSATLTCVKCREPVPAAEVLAVCGDRLYRKHLYFVSKDRHKDDPRAAWCPRDGCWCLLPRVPPPPPRARPAARLACPDCRADICPRCFAFSHPPNRCPAPHLHLRHRALAYCWQRLHTKKCPACFVRIQRAGGCTQMRCTSCRTKFCWRCRGVLHFPDPTDAHPGPGPSSARRTHMCVCPRITEAVVVVSLAGGALIALPLALATAVVVAPPALIAFVFLSKETKSRAKADITTFLDRL